MTVELTQAKMSLPDSSIISASIVTKKLKRLLYISLCRYSPITSMIDDFALNKIILSLYRAKSPITLVITDYIHEYRYIIYNDIHDCLYML